MVKKLRESKLTKVNVIVDMADVKRKCSAVRCSYPCAIFHAPIIVQVPDPDASHSEDDVDVCEPSRFVSLN
jgi:hypothetical protein